MHFVFNAAANELLSNGKRIDPRNVIRNEYTELNMALVNVWYVATRSMSIVHCACPALHG